MKHTPLKYEELTAEQKIGMTLMGAGGSPGFTQFPYAIEKIKKRELGTVWVISDQYDAPEHFREHIKQIHEAADYPVLVIMDAERGYGEFRIGRQMALGYVDDADLTYRFARAVGARAREDGYTGICSPILDPGGLDVICPTRSFNLDKEGILRHGRAYIQGLHDAGVLSIVKHFPSLGSKVDTHLFEGHCDLTKEEIINTNLYPYIQLCKEGLIDGIMSGHSVAYSIDPENPATFSTKVMNIIKDNGFDGFFITDDMSMLGICAKYGTERFSKCIASGADICLEWNTEDAEKEINRAINAGSLPMERIDDAAKRIIRAQEKITRLTPYKLTEADFDVAEEVNRRSICQITKNGVPASIPQGGKHLFVLMTEQNTDFSAAKSATAMVEQGDWLNPVTLSDHIKSRFPNSGVITVKEFPDRIEMCNAVHDALKYDDTVLVYFSNWQSYVGGESLTPRIVALAESLYQANRAKSLVFYGNPNLLSKLPDFDRIIAGCNNQANTKYCIDVLAGIIPAEGKLPYDIK